MSTLALAAMVHAQQPGGDEAACARLAATLKLPDTKVTAAHAVAAGRFVAPGASRTAASQAYADLPAFCRVELTLKPSPDSDIQSEVWLPQSGWNGKFQEVGNGAWAGSIQYGALAAALRRGYAAASTNAGHTGEDASFALGHPEKLTDFGFRAVHETAVQGKRTIAAFYGRAPQLSYFNGCSGGGRMAFQEAQRFPADFDAILAGAPGYDRVNQSVQMLMNAKATLDHPDSMIPSSKYAVIHRAAISACDAADGLKDGLISDPLRCHFDPKVIECKGADARGLPDLCSGRGGDKDLRRGQESNDRRRDLSRAGAGQRAAVGRSSRRSGAACRRQRSVQVRRLQGSALGFQDIRSGEGLRRGAPDRQPGAEPHVSRSQVIRRTRGQAAHLSRVGRPERRAALVGELPREAGRDHGPSAGG